MTVDHIALETLLSRLKALRRNVKANTSEQIARLPLREEAKALGTTWFKDFAPALKRNLDPQVHERYSAHFTRLVRLSNPNNLKQSYLSTLDAIIKPFPEELLIPSHQGSFSAGSSTFDVFLTSLARDEDSEYLTEAINCAKAGYHRAAAVLGWSAAIDRIHRALEQGGLDKFNAMSHQMAAATTGRYKKFNKAQNVMSLAELREVFDTTILWIVEAMGMIDTNQHTRLLGCFDMRCHGAHPGDAPITPYNLMSFFSDLEQIVFMNEKFRIAKAPQA